MAWSWSHSQEAYENARENLSTLDRETLEIIFAEWRAAQGKGGVIHNHNHFHQRKYDRALKHAKTLPDDVLADFIWEQASELATCDNGGFNAWMCPSGCGCHCVSFSPPAEPENEELDDVELEDE